MTDIVERLRSRRGLPPGVWPSPVCIDAADELDRLRREVQAYKDAATARDRNEDELRRELAEAQRDAARLDYLQENPFAIIPGSRGTCWRLWGKQDTILTIRAAIDDAMASTPAPSEVPK